MLLYGPPGTGKTLMARQIGKMLNGKDPKVCLLLYWLAVYQRMKDSGSFKIQMIIFISIFFSQFFEKNISVVCICSHIWVGHQALVPVLHYALPLDGFKRMDNLVHSS